jgi:diaminohydroxyphosphoribosylaminopyrimidine deaminase/5-amino-6-(5-phosphoribosylamino)uracil reductase
MIWELLLKIKNELRKRENTGDNTAFNIQNFRVEIDYVPKDFLLVFRLNGKDGDIEINFDSPFSPVIAHNTLLDEQEVQQFMLYLPYCVLPYFSKKNKKCFAITHFAQTLDGRIASSSGSSKWIGNEQNLIHAHKMRALCDAILVGASTVVVDDPKLDVRHVTGENPRVVVVGGERIDLSKYYIFGSDPILFCEDKNGIDEGFKKIKLTKYQDEFETKEILEGLFNIGLTSVYIEGGSKTTSSFLRQSNIDQLQIHISPRILGSGVSGFSFEGINDMEDAINFNKGRFIPMGDHMMFLGELL